MLAEALAGTQPPPDEQPGAGPAADAARSPERSADFTGGPPAPELVWVPWRAADIQPTVGEVLASLDPADPLPGLPQTGWASTMRN